MTRRKEQAPADKSEIICFRTSTAIRAEMAAECDRTNSTLTDIIAEGVELALAKRRRAARK